MHARRDAPPVRPGDEYNVIYARTSRTYRWYVPTFARVRFCSSADLFLDKKTKETEDEATGKYVLMSLCLSSYAVCDTDLFLDKKT